ncbi:MAG: LysR family transcriptional regulator [Hyphomicrobiaceae bacterium]
MELRHCRYFLAVIEAGTITRAASHLGMSQPSLSQQIRQLEESLGSKLFDRGRQTQLTAVGEMLVPHARHLVEAAARAQQEIIGGLTLDGGKLNIAFIPSLEPLVSLTISEFTRKFPSITINLRQQMGRAIDRLLIAGEIDLGVAVRRVSPPEIKTTVLYREPYVLAFRKGHLLEDERCNRLSTIGDTPFAIFSYGSFSRDITDSYLSRLKFHPKIRLEAESLECLLNIVAATDLCAMLPRNAVARHDELSFHDLVNPRPSRPVALLSHGRRNPSPALREFTKLIKANAKIESR